MALGPKLQLKQTQSLSMTPQLMQSIKLLQMGHAELAEFVFDQVEKNPLLELKTGERDIRTTDADQLDAHADTHQKMTESSAAQVNDLDGGSENLFEGEPKRDFGGTQVGASNASTSNDTYDLDTISNLSEHVTLAQTLEFQIALSVDDKPLREVASFIVHALDEDGYFRDSIDATAEHLSVSTDLILDGLKIVQKLDPSGVGARNLSECLKLQLIDRKAWTSQMEALVNNLDLLAKREFGKLTKICGVKKEELGYLIEEIRSLDPKPASQFQDQTADTISPDVLISQSNDGGWSIDLNQNTLPKLLVNRAYHAELSNVINDEASKTFVNDCMASAKWLERTLDQRANTILKVATEIVKRQDMFFAKGPDYMKPMRLADVAESIGMHESTISRVTSNKFLMCDQGMFELKHFFSSSIQSNDGADEQFSSEAVKHRIRQFVNGEDPSKILSDDKLAELLQETGVHIARRTVAKYREALKIPSSSLRRRQKNAIL